LLIIFLLFYLRFRLHYVKMEPFTEPPVPKLVYVPPTKRRVFVNYQNGHMLDTPAMLRLLLAHPAIQKHSSAEAFSRYFMSFVSKIHWNNVFVTDIQNQIDTDVHERRISIRIGCICRQYLCDLYEIRIVPPSIESRSSIHPWPILDTTRDSTPNTIACKVEAKVEPPPNEPTTIISTQSGTFGQSEGYQPSDTTLDMSLPAPPVLALLPQFEAAPIIPPEPEPTRTAASSRPKRQRRQGVSTITAVPETPPRSQALARRKAPTRVKPEWVSLPTTATHLVPTTPIQFANRGTRDCACGHVHVPDNSGYVFFFAYWGIL